MKSRRKILSCILVSCASAAIGFASPANAADTGIMPPPKPAFDTVITPGGVPGKDIERGHHHHKSKDDVKKDKSGKSGDIS